MIERQFSLLPFSQVNVPAIRIVGIVRRQTRTLTLHYALTGDIEALLLPPISSRPSRRDELWKATCFEFFLAVKGLPEYWEFNMAPSGDWNVYRMDAYRRIGFREETRVSQLAFELKKSPDNLSVTASVDLSAIIRADQELEMAVTAIIQSNHGHETYWALTHPAPEADFHLRDGFILALAGETHPLRQSARDA